MNKNRLPLIFILFIAAFLRFYNLMHDAPYFFDPDERNMAIAISRFQLPMKVNDIPGCIISEFSRPHKSAATNELKTANNCSLNPHFFAYGQFPLYLAYVSDQLVKPISLSLSRPDKQSTDSHVRSTDIPSAFFWLRFWSALSSTLTVLLVYLITKQLISINNFKLKIVPPQRDPANGGKYLAAIFAAFTPGLIQAAHFGTTESLLTFFFLSSIYFSMRLVDQNQISIRTFLIRKAKFILLLSLAVGLAIGSKLTGLFFFIPPVIAISIGILKTLFQRKKNFYFVLLTLLTYCITGLLILLGSILIGILSSPYNLVEPENFRSAVFGYEADVAMGKYEAFYTRQFVNTTPVLFQIEKVFPYTLGWPVFIMGAVGLSMSIVQIILYFILFVLRKYKKANSKLQKYIVNSKKIKLFDFLSVFLIFDLSFLIFFIPNAFLFAKWTRFMTPLFPFFAIFSAFALIKFLSILNLLRSQFSIFNFQFSNNTQYTNFQIKNLSFFSNFKSGALWAISNFGWVIGLLVFTSILPGLAFMSIYFNEDSRLTASKWIYQHIPSDSYVLYDTANVIDIPLGIPNYKPGQDYRQTGVSFDFYHMDENPIIYSQLVDHLVKSNYIYIPSRRIFKNYPRLPQKYPLVTKYYQLLFSGSLGFEKVAQFSSFPRLGPFVFPDEDAEETYTVFDHPVLRIYKKVKPMVKEEYNRLLSS